MDTTQPAANLVKSETRSKRIKGSEISYLLGGGGWGVGVDAMLLCVRMLAVILVSDSSLKTVSNKHVISIFALMFS